MIAFLKKLPIVMTAAAVACTITLVYDTYRHFHPEAPDIGRGVLIDAAGALLFWGLSIRYAIVYGNQSGKQS